MKILGINEVGVLQTISGEYVCWNNDIQKFYLSANVNNAQLILGDKEFNAKRMSNLYEKHTGDNVELTLMIKPYAYMAGGKSCFVETLQPDVLYAYVN